MTISADGELVADEQLIGDELHFLGVEQYMPAPPLLEFEIARRLGVDLGIEVVVLRPEGVGRVEVLEVRHEPRAVELAVAEIAHQCGEPSAAQQAASVAHRVLPAARQPNRIAANRRG